MNYYTNTNFTGHYPVGTAAVVHARSQKEAAERLNAELVKVGLPGDAKPQDMNIFRIGVRILLDGQY